MLKQIQYCLLLIDILESCNNTLKNPKVIETVTAGFQINLNTDKLKAIFIITDRITVTEDANCELLTCFGQMNIFSHIGNCGRLLSDTTSADLVDEC